MSAPRSGLHGWITRQAAVIATVTCGLVVAGLVAALRLPSGIYPELDFPRIVVVARAGDTPPEQMQATVVRPLEGSLATVIGVRRLRTRIIRGSAEIALQFVDGADMWHALQLVDAAIANARGELPPDVEIESEKVTPADFPILSFNLVGGTSVERREAADGLVRPAFSRVPGVGSVEVVGGDPREVEVVLDPARVAALHLRPTQVARSVGDGIVRRGIGRFDELGQLMTATVETDTTGIEALARLPVAVTPNGPIALGDVAQVFEGAPDRSRAVHGSEGDAVQVSVARMVGASAPEVSRGVEDMAASLRLPRGLRLVPVYDQGRLVREAIAGVRDAILVGIVLTIGVLAFFLRDARSGLLAALSVPVTLVVTFLVMAILRQTLNLMSLGGMAVAIGLVIDDAIVVVEAIVRHLEEGLPADDAVRLGLDEMTGPVVGTTLTTVVVLLPLTFLSGIAGAFFTALAVTLAAAVAISLFFALFVLPLLARRFLAPSRRAHGGGHDCLVGAYARALAVTLRRRGIVVATAVAGLALGVAAWRVTPSGFLPEMDEGGFVLDYFLPAGSSLDATASAASRIEAMLAATPDVTTWSRRTAAELGPVTATELNRGDISVQLRPRRQRRGVEDVMDDVRQRIEAQLPEVRVEFVQILEDVIGDLSGSPRPVEVRLLGPDQAVLARLAGDAEKALDGTPHLEDYYRGVEAQVPVWRHAIDTDAVARLGLSAADVADDFGLALHGETVGSIPRYDRLVPVRVRFPDAVRFRPDVLAAQPLAAGADIVPLSRVAAGTRSAGASMLYRQDLIPAALASGDLEGSDLGGLVREMSKRLAGIDLPAGYRMEVGGRIEGQARAFRQLLSILGLGILSVFAVLVAQLGSARPALLVLLTIPPAVAGGLMLLAATRVALNVSSLMGVVLLVGLVVKNGILLVQNALPRLAEAPLEVALVEAGRRRLRPILMTTACTIFGLVPLAFSIGTGSELQRPLAIVVIGGLISSTIATLFVLPALAGFLLRQGRTTR